MELFVHKINIRNSIKMLVIRFAGVLSPGAG